MATAEELLSGSISQDKTFVIDNDLRTIIIPKTVPTLGVESDDDVNRVEFRMPSTYCGTDLSTFKIRINYLNANAEPDVYEVTDAVKRGGGVIKFSWLVGRHAAMYKGDVKFSVCMKDVDSTGKVNREFNTTIASLPILEGLETGEQAIVEYHDIFEEWRSMLFGVGDTEEQRLKDTAIEQQENIAQKGAEVLATIPEDYTTTHNNADEAVRTKADAIIQTVEGDVIAVNDSSDDHLRGLRIFGKTTQVSTTGKNLLNVEENLEMTGVKDIPVAIPAGEYILSHSGETHSSTSGPFILFVDNNRFFSLVSGSDLSSTITLADDETKVRIYTYFDTRSEPNSASGSIGESATFNQLMISVNGGAYEPYSGGVASPSSEWPQELVAVGSDTGAIETAVCGKNLFDYNGAVKSAYLDYVLNATLDHGTITVSGTSMLGYGTLKTSLPLGVFKKGKTYRISRVYNTFHAGFWFYDENNVNIGSLTTENSVPIIIPENAHHMSLFYAGLTPEAEVNLTEQFMLNLGTEALPWEPSVEAQSISYSCPSGLPGIPVPSGGNYTDSNGQQWVCDEVDFERGVYIQRINTIVCDGTEAVTREERSNGTYRFNIVPTNLVRANPYPGGYFSHFVYDLESPIGNNGVDRAFCMWTNGRIYGRYDDIASAEDMAAWLTSQYENGTPFTVAYVLETPVETTLTQEEIAAFKALYSNHPNTTVLNDSGAFMELSYNADTKTYVQNLLVDTLEVIENGSY